MALIPKQMRHVASQWSIPLNEPRKRFPIHLCPTPGLACCRRLNLATLPMPRPTYPSSERRRTDFSFNPKIVPFNPCICTFISQHKPRYHNSIPHNNVYTTAISNVRVTSSNLHRCFIVPTLSPLVWLICQQIYHISAIRMSHLKSLSSLHTNLIRVSIKSTTKLPRATTRVLR